MTQFPAKDLTAHVSKMYRVALRIVGSPEAAQEVAQDACVRALQGAGQFDGRAALATWLHRITVNCAHDHLRKHRQAEGSRTDWDSEIMGMLAMLESTPAQRAEQSETYRLALKSIAALPEDCRSAFMLTQLDGYSYDEAAAIESLSRGTVASRVFRARKILMEQMSHHLAGESP
jgi:RNA polymerase sigma-70 factor (ECF subfamily)